VNVVTDLSVTPLLSSSQRRTCDVVSPLVAVRW
jgi:hypothetical protein